MKAVSFLIKPASSLCNMRCRYCFYSDVAAHRLQQSYGVMKTETSHALIDRALALAPNAHITFAFQGGEPTCAGINYFLYFTSYVNANRTDQTIHYAIQTNGLVLDDAWLDLFKKHQFLVGVSLDGYAKMHDWLRQDARGNGTFAHVLAHIKSLQKAGIDTNVLTVLTNQLAQHPQTLYRFYAKEGIDFVQLIPCLPGLDAASDAYSLEPESFASFYKTFYRLWLEDFKRGKHMNVTLFDNLIPLFAGVRPQQCGMLGACAPQFVIESNGDVYPCDFYVLDRYRLGNITESSLEKLVTTPKLGKFLSEPRRPCNQCASCPFERICHRNCKRLNIAYYRENYCGYRDFLEYAAPSMMQIARQIRRV